MYKIIALIGEAGSGKDTIQNLLMDFLSNRNIPVNKIVSCTTRPPRDYEQEGFDYFFLKEDAFSEQVLNGEMLEATSFRGWFYGTSLKSLKEDCINIGVFNPDGIYALQDDSRISLEVYYLFVPAAERIVRQLKREQNPDIDEIFRRYKTDQSDFMDIQDEIPSLITLFNSGSASPQDIVFQIENLTQYIGQNAPITQ